MKRKINLSLDEINQFAQLFSSMLETKGHGLTFILTKNKYELVQILNAIKDQVEMAKKPFLTEETKSVFKENVFIKKLSDDYILQDDENIGHKLSVKDQKELQNALDQISEQNFKIDLIKLDQSLFEIACNDGIFDEIDLIPYFPFIEKFN